MNFTHYTDTKLKAVKSRRQKDEGDMKPQGFWFSVDGDDDWLEWCTHEKFQLHKTQLRYRVKLQLSRMLILTTAHDVYNFTTMFVTKAPWEKTVPDPRTSLLTWMNWKAVAEQYAGIIIAPYQWPCRLNLMWYYGWDCASGCVWDATAVRSIRLLDGKHLKPHRDTKQDHADP